MMRSRRRPGWLNGLVFGIYQRLGLTLPLLDAQEFIPMLGFGGDVRTSFLSRQIGSIGGCLVGAFGRYWLGTVAGS